MFVVMKTCPAVTYILWSPPPSLPIPITTGWVAVVVIVIVELPPEFTRSRAAIFTSTKFRLRVASPPWIRVGLEMTSLPRAGGVCVLSDIGKQHNKLPRVVSAGSKRREENWVVNQLGTYHIIFIYILISCFYMICSWGSENQSERVETEKKTYSRRLMMGTTNSRSCCNWLAIWTQFCGLFLDPTRLVTADRRY